MHNFVLTSSSTILCPHGGVVTHIPITNSQFRIEGLPVMLLTDVYLVAGCPGGYHGPALMCRELMWLNPSTRFFVSAIPALLNISTPMILTMSGIATGAANIVNHQTSYPEPAELTFVD